MLLPFINTADNIRFCYQVLGESGRWGGVVTWILRDVIFPDTTIAGSGYHPGTEGGGTDGGLFALPLPYGGGAVISPSSAGDVSSLNVVGLAQQRGVLASRLARL